MESLLSERFQKVLKQYRIDKKISQEKLAEKSGLDRTYISGFERGVRNVSLISLEKILNGLELDCNEFLRLCLSNEEKQ